MPLGRKTGPLSGFQTADDEGSFFAASHNAFIAFIAFMC